MARLSLESDRRHLLSSSASSIAPSTNLSNHYDPTDSDSITTTPRQSTDTTTHHPIIAGPSSSSSSSSSSSASPTQATKATTTQPQPYRGFPSQEAYLEALRTWVQQRECAQLDTALIGWYGSKTTEDYMNRTDVDLNLGLRNKLREMKREKQRRATIADTRATVRRGEATPNGEQREEDEGVDEQGSSGGGSGGRRRFAWARRGSKLTLTRTR